MDVQLSNPVNEYECINYSIPIINGFLTCLKEKQVEARINSLSPEYWALSTLNMI